MNRKCMYTCALAIILASTFVCIGNLSNTEVSNNIRLADLEALSGCEVSSNASNNQGYCSPLYGSAGDSCTESGDGASVRCSGNF